MQRVGFRLKLKKHLVDEYVARHRTVWPDMLAALSATGWTNYSLFLDPDDATLFGYFETPDLDAALAGMAATEVNERWQLEMSHFFEELEGLKPDQGFIKLDCVFYLA